MYLLGAVDGGVYLDVIILACLFMYGSDTT